MKLVPCSRTAFVVAFALVLVCSIGSFADDSESPHQLTLADLAAYRAALSGKATGENAKSSEPPVRVVFRDLWNRTDEFRGRRVMIQGRVERVFRQGPIGSFPALAEVWVVSPAGDPFCLVVPNESGTGILPVNEHGLEDRAAPAAIPEQGKTVRFTGTFLKLVRYAGGDGARLAPLVVGNQPPVSVHEPLKANGARSFSSDDAVSGGVHTEDGRTQWAGSSTTWLLGLTLAVLAAAVLAWQHVRAPTRRSKAMSSFRRMYLADPDPQLEFLEPRDERNLRD
jgi:hypothetical protein